MEDIIESQIDKTCKDMGWVVGDEFTVLRNIGTFHHGESVRLTKDDNTLYPKFATTDYISGQNTNRYEYLPIHFVKKIKAVETSSKITYKDFLASMPKSASACVTMYGDGEVIANVYGFEFVCKTEERAEEVYAALITLFKEN